MCLKSSQIPGLQGIHLKPMLIERTGEKFPYQKGYLAPGVKRAEAANVLDAWPAHKDVPSS